MRHRSQRKASSLYRWLNYTVRLTAKTLKGFITSLINDHKTCHSGNRLAQVFMKPRLKRCCHFHIWNVDPSLH